MPFSDKALSQRLERAEGFACVQHVDARRRHYPSSGAEWIQCGGAFAAFDGVNSPCTQTFGLGIFEELTNSALNTIEAFFHDRGASVMHEVSPFAGVAAMELLCKRGYTPVELSNVLYRPLEPVSEEPQSQSAANNPAGVTVRIAAPEESQLWSQISANGWTHDHPELTGYMLELGAVTAAREHTVCFLAELDGVPGAAGVLCLHQAVALFGGSSTVPNLRKRGLQSALLEARMRYASDHGCDLAMMVAWPGTESQRNAERHGFRIAYTRTKWQLRHESQSK